MRAIKSLPTFEAKNASTLALLVDDISRMSVPEQKLLWMHLHKKKLTTLAHKLDASVPAHQLSSSDIDSLINEAKKMLARKRKNLRPNNASINFAA
jgi:hypothetical protein